jgi:hypothetical protein
MDASIPLRQSLWTLAGSMPVSTPRMTPRGTGGHPNRSSASGVLHFRSAYGMILNPVTCVASPIFTSTA